MTKKDLLSDPDFISASDDAEIIVYVCGLPHYLYGGTILYGLGCEQSVRESITVTAQATGLAEPVNNNRHFCSCSMYCEINKG